MKFRVSVELRSQSRNPFQYSLSKSTTGKGFIFSSNLLYEITIHRLGNTLYYLEEKIFQDNKFKGNKPLITIFYFSYFNVIFSINKHRMKMFINISI